MATRGRDSLDSRAGCTLHTDATLRDEWGLTQPGLGSPQQVRHHLGGGIPPCSRLFQKDTFMFGMQTPYVLVVP